jgi:hypothetical protein
VGKISQMLEDPSYRRLAKDPEQSMEQSTMLLLKKSSIPDNATEQP